MPVKLDQERNDPESDQTRLLFRVVSVFDRTQVVGWEVWWALVFGFFISAVVQAWHFSSPPRTSCESSGWCCGC
jgi:hypothetical protein